MPTKKSATDPSLRDYVAPTGTNRATDRKWMVGAGGVAALALGLGALGLASSDSADEGAAAVAVGPAAPSSPAQAYQSTPVDPDAEREAADLLLESQKAAGWIPYGSTSAITGELVDGDLWISWNQEEFESVEPDAEGRVSVHKGADGPVVGYHYSGVGFVSLEEAETFDVEQHRAG